MPKKMIYFCAISALSISSILIAGAMRYSNITGKFIITGQYVIDPPVGQKKDRLGLFLSGEVAKQTYLTMPAKPITADDCEDGLKIKTAGGLACESHADKSYACSVAILLSSGKTAQIGAC